MHLKLNRALCASTALATGLLLASSALAQSTATQIQELVVTGARGAPNVSGVITQVQDAKDVAIVNHEFFEHQQAGQNFAQLINLLPGVNYTSEDATGNLSGDLRIHAFDGAHIGVTIDGTPVNDTGNYAVFPGEYLTAEITDRIIVNLGATSVDSPTASAVGGTVELVTKIPTKDREVIGQATAGSNNFTRYYGEIESGEVGPWGTRMFLTGNYDHADKWVGAGPEMKEGFDARIYQPLKGSDFLSLSASYVLEHDYFYDGSSLAQFAQPGLSKSTLDYNTQWSVPTAVAGKVDTPLASCGTLINNGCLNGFQQGSAGASGLDGNFWALHPNPVVFGTIRGASKFSLTDKLTFTFDPSFFYTLANGGGVQGISETDPRLKGNKAGSPGVDLNGDGDTLDTVDLYSPNNTNTHRWVILSSLLYDMDEHNHFSLGYTLDYGMHRQTQEFGFINPVNGLPGSVFGGNGMDGSTPVATADGSTLRGRDRHSIAELNQVNANYIGKFMDDKLHVNVGVRAPFFKRDLEQFCYTFNGTSAYCDTIDPALVQAAYNAGVVAGNTNALSTLLFGKTGSISFDAATKLPNFRMPFKQTFNFNKVLPNAGVTYRIADDHMIYATYAEGFSAPKTDDLYSSVTALVQPETSESFGVGYRYQTSAVIASVDSFYVNYKNRIVQSFDPTDPTLSIDRNIGAVDIYGVDLSIGAHPFEHFSVYASAEFIKSDVKSNEVVATAGAVALALPTAGKELVLNPDQTFTANARYDFGWIDVGANVKYTSRRFLDDMNTASLPDITVVDFDARMPITWWGAQNTYLQFNVFNLTNTREPYKLTSSITNAFPVVLNSTTTKTASSYFPTFNAPRTLSVTLHAQF
ncbi:TonB-dependent receptor [Phenylobacterium sp.]|jgi:iron complex outermembrane receptor protein|uniref:TonB-dependent receptor n=1 Tax=Phenylobacterium sp. TaxID=1871053 RepID=UPI002E370B25|nr:TonB-dependent receptor [Phenylobacterium sp.]HEX3365620.1 TonB-dependent receptor [Phenylobacterium sp.]